MGDRVSIAFKKGKEESVSLFNHWGGKEFASDAIKYVNELKKEVGDNKVQPLERLEPHTVMVDFIREITQKEKRVMSSLYLGKDEEDGDNSDNGHFNIHLDRNICPICLEPFDEYPALSRVDNKTNICSACGVKEALTNFNDK